MAYFDDWVYVVAGILLLVAIWFYVKRQRSPCGRIGQSGEAGLSLVSDTTGSSDLRERQQQRTRGFSLYQHARSHAQQFGIEQRFLQMGFPPPPPSYSETMKQDLARRDEAAAERVGLDVEGRTEVGDTGPAAV